MRKGKRSNNGTSNRGYQERRRGVIYYFINTMWYITDSEWNKYEIIAPVTIRWKEYDDMYILKKITEEIESDAKEEPKYNIWDKVKLLHNATIDWEQHYHAWKIFEIQSIVWDKEYRSLDAYFYNEQIDHKATAELSKQSEEGFSHYSEPQNIEKIVELFYKVGDKVIMWWCEYTIEGVNDDLYEMIEDWATMSRSFYHEDIDHEKTVELLKERNESSINFWLDGKETLEEIEWYHSIAEDIDWIDELYATNYHMEKCVLQEEMRENYTQFIASKIEDMTFDLHGTNDHAIREILEKHLLPNTNTNED